MSHFYTFVIDEEGNSFPAAGCRITQRMENGIPVFMLELITMTGQPLELKNEKGIKYDSNSPDNMNALRDRITFAIAHGHQYIDLRKNKED